MGYLIANGTVIQRHPVTVYRDLGTASIEARNLALGIGSDNVAVYDTDGACLYTVIREDHGTRARLIPPTSPHMPDGRSWLDAYTTGGTCAAPKLAAEVAFTNDSYERRFGGLR